MCLGFARSTAALVLIPDSTDLRPGILSQLHIHHRTIRNEFTVRFAQIYLPLKITTYPIHPDNYRLVPFKVSNFLRPVLLEEAKGIQNDRLCINYACIACLLYCASDVNVNFKTFSIT